uniref:Uncharacterized protein n=1 Tax=Arundo donax TaxID=35708 RepID=A0A0A9DWL6_ARUDO
MADKLGSNKDIACSSRWHRCLLFQYPISLSARKELDGKLPRIRKEINNNTIGNVNC